MMRTPMLAITVLVLAVATVDAADKAAKAAAKCSAGKQKAAVKKIASELACHQKAARTGEAVDPECLEKADTTFRATIAKIDAKGGCLVTGDEVEIAAVADQCALDLRTLTPATPPTCGESAFPECGGSCLPGLVCQAFLRTTRECNPGGGGGPQTECSSTCACVAPATACGGQPCAGDICRRTVVTPSCGGAGSDVSTCCSDAGDPCASGHPGCCCAGACFVSPVGGASLCLSGLSCTANNDGTMCQ